MGIVNKSDSGNIVNLGSEAVDEAQVTNYGEVIASSIQYGTMASGSFSNQSERLRSSNPVRIEGDKAFKSLKAQVNKVVPYLVGKGNEHLTMVSMSVDCKRGVITITLNDKTTRKLAIDAGNRSFADGAPQELTLVDALMQIKKQTKLEVKKELFEYLHKFDMAFLRIGISTDSYFSLNGPEVFGSQLGGKALNMRNFSLPKCTHDKYSSDLVKDANNKSGVLRAIDRSSLDETGKKNAVDKVLRAKGFLASFQNSLTKVVDERAKASKKMTNLDEKRKFEQATHEYKKLQEQLLDANWYALRVHTLYDTPKECYQRVLQEYHEDVFADQKEEDKPSFRDFCESSNSLEGRNLAAETASLLITDDAEYKIFCDNHGIIPRSNHVNSLLNQALNLKDPSQIQFHPLGLYFEAEDANRVKDLMADALKEAGTIADKVNSIAKDQAHADRLKTALAAKTLFPLLKAKKP